MTDDPVLRQLTRHISDDEVSHYKHFYRYLRKYQAREGQRRAGLARAMWNRVRMIDGNDTRIALRHIYCERHPGARFDERVFRQMRRAAGVMIGPHFPHRMCVQMLLTPLSLPHRTQRVLAPVLEAIARRVVP